MINYFELIKCYEIAFNLLKIVRDKLFKSETGIEHPNKWDNGESQVYKFLKEIQILFPEILEIKHNKVDENSPDSNSIRINQEDGDYTIIFRNNIILGIDLKVGIPGKFNNYAGCISKTSLNSKFTSCSNHIYWTISYDRKLAYQIRADLFKKYCDLHKNDCNTFKDMFNEETGECELFIGGITQNHWYDKREETFDFMLKDSMN